MRAEVFVLYSANCGKDWPCFYARLVEKKRAYNEFPFKFAFYIYILLLTCTIDKQNLGDIQRR